MMQDQLERSRKETEGIREVKERVEGVIEGLSQAKLADFEIKDTGGDGEGALEEGKDVWEVLEREFG